MGCKEVVTVYQVKVGLATYVFFFHMTFTDTVYIYCKLHGIISITTQSYRWSLQIVCFFGGSFMSKMKLDEPTLCFLQSVGMTCIRLTSFHRPTQAHEKLFFQPVLFSAFPVSILFRTRNNKLAGCSNAYCTRMTCYKSSHIFRICAFTDHFLEKLFQVGASSHNVGESLLCCTCIVSSDPHPLLLF